MAKQQTKRAIIEYKVAKPFVDATALGVGWSAFAIVLQGPALNWGLLGAGFSLVWFWGNNNLTRPKRGKPTTAAVVGAGTVTVNSAGGSRKVRVDTFEYAPDFIVRESWGEAFWRLFGRKGDHARRPMIVKPMTPREFVFQSHYDGQPVELREDDVRRFLRTAWKERRRGRGLSYRRWVREWRDRPQWYRDLGPHWYRALLVLLREAQQVRKCQLVVCTGSNWYALARDPHITLAILREAEVMKGTHQPDKPKMARVIDISTDRGESSF